MLFRGKAETARGGKIEAARIASNLSDHAGQIAAPQPLLQGKQGIFGRFRFDMDQPFAQIGGQAVNIWAAAALDRASILHPQHVSPIIGFGERIWRLRSHPLCRS